MSEREVINETTKPAPDYEYAERAATESATETDLPPHESTQNQIAEEPVVPESKTFVLPLPEAIDYEVLSVEIVESDEDVDEIIIELIESDEEGEEITYYEVVEGNNGEEYYFTEKDELPPLQEVIETIGAEGDTEELRRVVELRVRAHREKLNWSKAADELSTLLEYYPDVDDIKLKLAETLTLAVRWDEAFDVYDEMLVSSKNPSAVIRAYEMRSDLRKRFGDLAGFKIGTIRHRDDKTSQYKSFARHFFNRRFAAAVEWSKTDYETILSSTGNSFSDDEPDFGIELKYFYESDQDISIFTRTKSKAYTPRSSYGVHYHLNIISIGDMKLMADKGLPWTDPVEAVSSGGYLNRYDFHYIYPFVSRWYARGSVGKRNYYINNRDYIGRTNYGSATVGKRIVNRDGNPDSNLRHVNLDLTYTSRQSSQDTSQKNIIDLLDKSKELDLELSLHYLYDNRTALDVSAWLGRDNERDMQISDFDLYGFAAGVSTAIRDDITLFADWQFRSRNSILDSDGSYWNASAGMTKYFDPLFVNDKKHW